MPKMECVCPWNEVWAIYIYIYICIVYFGARYFSGHFSPFLSKDGLIFLDSTRHFSCRKEQILDFGGHFLPQKDHPGPKAFLQTPHFPWKNKRLGISEAACLGFWGLIPAETKLHFHRRRFALSLSSLWLMSVYFWFTLSLSQTNKQTRINPPQPPRSKKKKGTRRKKRKEQERNPKPQENHPRPPKQEKKHSPKTEPRRRKDQEEERTKKKKGPRRRRRRKRRRRKGPKQEEKRPTAPKQNQEEERTKKMNGPRKRRQQYQERRRPRRRTRRNEEEEEEIRRRRRRK